MALFPPRIPHNDMNKDTFKTGFDEQHIVGHLPTGLLLCSCCQCVPRLPATLETCGHLFCEWCISNNLQKSPGSHLDQSRHRYALCPNCRQRYYHSNILPYSSMQMLARHYFQQIVVRCPHDCGFEGGPTAVDEHQMYTCPKRPITCPYNGCGFVGEAQTLANDHFPTCKYEPRHCSNCQLPTQGKTDAEHDCLKSLKVALQGNNFSIPLFYITTSCKISMLFSKNNNIAISCIDCLKGMKDYGLFIPHSARMEKSAIVDSFIYTLRQRVMKLDEINSEAYEKRQRESAKRALVRASTSTTTQSPAEAASSSTPAAPSSAVRFESDSPQSPPIDSATFLMPPRSVSTYGAIPLEIPATAIATPPHPIPVHITPIAPAQPRQLPEWMDATEHLNDSAHGGSTSTLAGAHDGDANAANDPPPGWMSLGQRWPDEMEVGAPLERQPYLSSTGTLYIPESDNEESDVEVSSDEETGVYVLPTVVLQLPERPRSQNDAQH